MGVHKMLVRTVASCSQMQYRLYSMWKGLTVKKNSVCSHDASETSSSECATVEQSVDVMTHRGKCTYVGLIG